MKTSKALMLNAVTSVGGHFSSIAYRIIQVPLLLGVLGVNDYGRWLLIYSFPSLLLLANFGFGTVSANYLAIHQASGEDEAAKRVYSSGLAAITGLCGAIFLIFSVTSPFVPWYSLIQTTAERDGELARAVILLVIAVLITFPCDLMSGRFRAARAAHHALALSAMRPWIELLFLVVIIQYRHSFDAIAFAVFAASLTYFMVFTVLSRRALPGITFSLKHVVVEDLRKIFGKGLSFQGLAMGNAFLQQGMLFVIQSTLGPAAVASVSTVRTLITAVIQALGMINTITWPEFTLFFGKKDYQRAARLHRLGTAITVFAGLAGWIFILSVGLPFYRWWTNNHLEMSFLLIFLFSLPIPMTALYACSASIHTACNQHEGLAFRFMLGAGLSIFACYLCAYWFGIEAAAATGIIVNLVSIRYAIRRAIELTHDTPSRFFKGVLHEFRHAPELAYKTLLKK